MELFVREPMFASLVAMEIDENGRIYVVEDSGYPLDTEHAVGKVWLLEDTNGDGKADVKRAVLNGFAITNPQHTMNFTHLRIRQRDLSGSRGIRECRCLRRQVW
jgi:hypothetical protein